MELRIYYVSAAIDQGSIQNKKSDTHTRMYLLLVLVCIQRGKGCPVTLEARTQGRSTHTQPWC
jgi:hypothetical protein